MRDPNIYFRETIYGTTKFKFKLLEYRLEKCNSFRDWLYYRLFRQWNAITIPICNPENVPYEYQDLSYDFAKCGKHNVPSLEWMQENIKTWSQYREWLTNLTMRNENE